MFLLGLILGTSCASPQNSLSLEAFVAVGLKTAFDEVSTAYQERTGVKVEAIYGASGTMLSQMILAQRGDIYLPASQDFMAAAEDRKAVDPATKEVVAFLVPALAVAKGNPKGIGSLFDLAQPGLRIGIANPEAAPVGKLAMDILDSAGLRAAVEKNIVVHARDAEDVVALLALGQLDAVITWDIYQSWAPERIEVIPISSQYIPRLEKTPVAVSIYSQHRQAAIDFIRFLVSPEAKAIFQRHGYLTGPPG